MEERAWATPSKQPPNRTATVATLIIGIAVCPILIAMYFRMESLANDLAEARAEIVQVSQLNTALKQTLGSINSKLEPDTRTDETGSADAKAGNETDDPSKAMRELAARFKAEGEGVVGAGGEQSLPPEAATHLASCLENTAEYIDLWGSFRNGALEYKEFYRARSKSRDQTRKDLSLFYSSIDTAMKRAYKAKKNPKPQAVDEVF